MCHRLVDIGDIYVKASHRNEDTQADPVRAYLQRIGREGAKVHQLDQTARDLGVATRRWKRHYQRQLGLPPEAALDRARRKLRVGSYQKGQP